MVRSWQGSGHIKIEPHKFAEVLDEIVKEMNEYYRSSGVKMNKAIIAVR